MQSTKQSKATCSANFLYDNWIMFQVSGQPFEVNLVTIVS